MLWKNHPIIVGGSRQRSGRPHWDCMSKLHSGSWDTINPSCSEWGEGKHVPGFSLVRSEPARDSSSHRQYAASALKVSQADGLLGMQGQFQKIKTSPSLVMPELIFMGGTGTAAPEWAQPYRELHIPTGMFLFSFPMYKASASREGNLFWCQSARSGKIPESPTLFPFQAS